VGRVEKIWIKRARRGVMDEVTRAVLVDDRGIEGNADRSRRRQVTLLDVDAWNAAAQTLGSDVDPVMRRANVLLSGIDLTATRDRVLRIGDCRVRIAGETKPCERMDEALPGLQKALRDRPWSAGAFAVVLSGGTIQPGDAVEWEA
jgi:MOSC domain-containing protein YiiM